MDQFLPLLMSKSDPCTNGHALQHRGGYIMAFSHKIRSIRVTWRYTTCKVSYNSIDMCNAIWATWQYICMQHIDTSCLGQKDRTLAYPRQKVDPCPELPGPCLSVRSNILIRTWFLVVVGPSRARADEFPARLCHLAWLVVFSTCFWKRSQSTHVHLAWLVAFSTLEEKVTKYTRVNSLEA